MSKYSLAHLSDGAVLTGLKGNVGNERGSLALGLAHIAETDERKLYVAAAHPSMVSYLVHELRFSEQAAYKRLRAARAARKFPVIFTAVANGQLHLSAIVLLTSHLTPENVDQLVQAAANISKADLERVLSGRDPQSEGQLSLIATSQPVAELESQLSPGTVVVTQNDSDEVSTATPVAAPTSPAMAVEELYDVHCRIDCEAHEQLLYAKALLSHAIPNGDVGRILKRAVKALVRELEKQKFGATDRPGKPRGSDDPRHIPVAVKREVWLRDGGQCAFRSDDGKRCPSHELVEFHHTTEVALGGTASVKDISLRCRTHNQYESERTFGKDFMRHKREQAKAARGRTTKAAAYALSPEEEDRTIWWLGIHGHSAEDARWALKEVGHQPYAFEGSLVRMCLGVLRERTEAARPASA